MLSELHRGTVEGQLAERTRTRGGNFAVSVEEVRGDEVNLHVELVILLHASDEFGQQISCLESRIAHLHLFVAFKL